MPAELPFAPVDGIIRRNADGLRVSADAGELLADYIEREGARLATIAARRADADGRKTLMAADFEVSELPAKEDVGLPIAPVDRIARLEMDERYRVSMEARIALASILESFAEEVAVAAATLARHADRRTITASDIKTYFDLQQLE